MVGIFDRTDWRGVPLQVGSLIVYPSEGSGAGLARSAMQMTSGRVLHLNEDNMDVAIESRSRTGKPQGRQRKAVTLSAVGMANVTVIG